MRTQRHNLYFTDLIVGIMAALALRGIQILPFANSILDETFRGMYADICTTALENSLEVRFRITTRAGEDSPTVHAGVYHLLQCRLATLDAPRHDILRIAISKSEAESYFENLPGSKTMYITLATRFLEELDHQKTLLR